MSTLGALYGHPAPPPRPRVQRAPSSSGGKPNTMTVQQPPAQRRKPRLRVSLIGLRRSGKSSMLNVVHNDLHPDDTLFLESSLKASTIDSDSFLPIAMIDMPGGILLGANKLAKGLPLPSSGNAKTAGAHTQQTRTGASTALSPDPSGCGSTSIPIAAPGGTTAAAAAAADLMPWTDVSAVIFVIDAQDDYFEALSKLHSVILSAFAENQTIDFHVFIHKIDGFSEDYRQETLADIRGKVLDDLVDSSPSFIAQPWSSPAPVIAAKKELDKGRSRSRDFGALGRSPLNTSSSGGVGPGAGGGGSGSGIGNGRGYDASASEVSLFSSGDNHGRRNDSGVPAAGQINLEADVQLHFHLTSIFDTSVFVAFSKVQQSLMQKTKSVESAAPPSASRHLAPPTTATEAGASTVRPSPLAHSSHVSSSLSVSISPSTLAESVEALCDSICSSCKFDKAFLFDLPTRTFAGSDSTPFDAASFDVIFEYAGFLSKFAGLYANVTPGPSEPNSASSGVTSSQPFPSSAPVPARRLATSVARLGSETSLAFWQLNDRLSLIAILKTDVHAKQSDLIDYNVCFFQRAVVQLLEVVQSGI